MSASENLYQIALRYGLAIEHFAFANGLPVGLAAPAGKRLLVPARRVLPAAPPKDGIVLNLPERGLFLFLGGKFDKFYPCAIGQPGRFATPPGNYKLASRVVNPTWLPPEWAGMGKDAVVPAGPDNPLGDRWMGLSAPGLGLHSTTSPTSIGSAASHGCMRMYPTMARELFDKVKVGMPVRIIYEPVKLGRDQEGLYAVVYPDVYGWINLRDTLSNLLRQEGVFEFFKPGSLDGLVKKPSGKPERLIDLRPRLERAPAQQNYLAMCEGRLWISSQGLKSLGFEVVYQSSSRSLLVGRKGQVHEFSLNSRPSVQTQPQKPTPIVTPSPTPEAPANPTPNPQQPEEGTEIAVDVSVSDDTDRVSIEPSPLETAAGPNGPADVDDQHLTKTPRPRAEGEPAPSEVAVVNWSGVSYFPVRDLFELFRVEIWWRAESQTLVVGL